MLNSNITRIQNAAAPALSCEKYGNSNGPYRHHQQLLNGCMCVLFIVVVKIRRPFFVGEGVI